MAAVQTEKKGKAPELTSDIPRGGGELSSTPVLKKEKKGRHGKLHEGSPGRGPFQEPTDREDRERIFGKPSAE